MTPKKVFTSIIIVFLFLIPAVLFIFQYGEHTSAQVKGATTRELTSKEKYDTSFLDPKYKTLAPVSFDLSQYNFPYDFDISAKNVLALNLATGEVCFSKNPNKQVPVASLVKVMTAIVALEHSDADAKIIVSEKAANMEPNLMGVSEGEVYTLRELLFGLILNSGNDAAIAIAEGVAGDEKTFTGWMNFKAKELGLVDTLFSDPDGLNLNDEVYYSSPYDLAVLSKYALDNFELLREIFSTFNTDFPKTGEHNYIYLENLTNLISTYPGAKGIKIGYTPEAGNTLITYAENGDAKILGVILDAVNQRYDAILLLDYCFAREGVQVRHTLL